MTAEIKINFRYAKVAVDVPLGFSFDYEIPEHLHEACKVGSWVVVPWGSGTRFGLVFELSAQTEYDEAKIKKIEDVLANAPTLPNVWLTFMTFAARYYQCGLGEIACPAIPKLLRRIDRKTRLDPFEKFSKGRRNTSVTKPASQEKETLALTDEQQAALKGIPLFFSTERPFQPTLLFGITGSGKTRVYFEWIAELIAREPSAQVLMLLPEINLTTALQTQVMAAFPHLMMAKLHSDLNETDRATHWLAVTQGKAQLILSTRMGVLTPFANLRGIVVDEEHDPSYKQREAPHYSARDLAIVLAKLHNVPIVLASATPSLETWQAAQKGRYKLLSLRKRATGALEPDIQIVPLDKKLKHGFTVIALEAIERALSKGQQALVFINRRGYAPVLHCASCGWLSECNACSAYQVLHRESTQRHRLICHHCANIKPVPKQCPKCGDLNIEALGQGTQRIEEGLKELFPSAKVARLDRDVSQRKGQASAFLENAHAGEVDILVGTQMLAKGHDFAALSEVIVVDSDGALFSSDFRAPERLFATLFQVAGRAGRAKNIPGTVTIQTRFPEHAIFQHLLSKNFEGFAQSQLEERVSSALPPFSYQVLIKAEASTMEAALKLLARLREDAQQSLTRDQIQGITLCDPVPMPMAKIAGVNRAQLLLESASRPSLQRWLPRWLEQARSQSGRWHIEIDPQEI